MAQAVQHHQAGRLAEAEAFYVQALRAHPRHPDALHLLGMIACQTGRFDRAVELIGQAVAGNGSAPDYHANFAFALQALGRATEAEEAARKALRLRGSFPEAANTLGNALGAQKRFEEAAAAYREALTGRPDYAEAQGNLGAVLRTLDRSSEAEPLLRAALSRNPNLVEARAALGLALLDLNRIAEGVATLQDALARKPAHGPALLALAGAYQRAGRDADAAPYYRRYMVVEPADAGAWNGYGLLLQAADCIDEAAYAYARSSRLSPLMPEALTNLGNVRRLQGRLDEAAKLHGRALDLRPDYAAAHANIALVFQDRGDEAAAEASFTRALDFDRGEAVARFNRAILRLRQGRLAQGWADYAHRFASPALGTARRLSMPEWQGEDISGRRILVWAEQGLGDTLMFGSVLPDLIARAGGVVIECDPRLIALLQRSFPTAAVRAPTANPRDVDLHIPMGTLPRLLRGRLADFPPQPGWLRPDPLRAALLGERLAALGPGLKVGIAWTSRRADAARRAAYTRLDQWAPVLATPGVRFVNLQYDGREDEITAAESRFGVRLHRWPDIDLYNDLDGSAALTGALDLVVTVASSVGETAGALGVPVWRVGGRDWTQLGAGVRPWFPTMRLFQPQAGQGIDHALAQVARELARGAA
ncbi:tetratricopeptide repeat protein [Azospirillum soli]|uniref:tetratricopeptide repeat protein n=1 Tax=Azospirillum soli TaxID=1304799 RepID=UPI0031B86214|nr:tetratricopeptide (TPR) repeat protein [Azospirillum soli]